MPGAAAADFRWRPLNTGSSAPAAPIQLGEHLPGSGLSSTSDVPVGFSWAASGSTPTCDPAVSPCTMNYLDQVGPLSATAVATWPVKRGPGGGCPLRYPAVRPPPDAPRL